MLKSKICTECKENKKLECYYRDYSIITKTGYRSKCKECCQKMQKERKSNDKNPLITEKICKDCDKILSISDYYKSTRHKDGYFARCKTCHESKEKTGYIIKRTEEYMKKYNEKRYKKPTYIIRSHIKKSVVTQIKRKKNYQKSSKYLGCSIGFFKDWIEYQFDEFMTWENHGSYWHFDHVTPCASFDLTNDDEILKCYNWKNYRPLEANENLEKSDTVIPKIIKNHKKIVQKYLEEIDEE